VLCFVEAVAPGGVLAPLLGCGCLEAVGGVGRALCCAGAAPLFAAGALLVPGFGLPAAALVTGAFVVCFGMVPDVAASFAVFEVLLSVSVCALAVCFVGVISLALAEGEYEKES